MRRIHLDLIGTLPTPEEVDAYVASKEPNKRTKTAAELLGRDAAYAAHWMTFWNDLLRNDYAGTGFIDGGRKQITDWLYASLRSNKPYDQFVRELISPTPGSEGFVKGIKWRGQVNASQVPEVQFAQNVTQVFLGENLKCASCHDSFINDWKLADAYGMAAIIAPQPIQMHRCDKPTGEKDFRLGEQTFSEVLFPGRRLTFTNEIEHIEAEVERLFPGQIDGFRALVEAVRSHPLSEVEAPFHSARAELARFVTDPDLAEMLLLPTLYYGSAHEDDVDWTQFVVLFRSIFLEGLSRPNGGIRTMINVLIKRLKSLGADLRMNAGRPAHSGRERRSDRRRARGRNPARVRRGALLGGVRRDDAAVRRRDRPRARRAPGRGPPSPSSSWSRSWTACRRTWGTARRPASLLHRGARPLPPARGPRRRRLGGRLGPRTTSPRTRRRARACCD